VLHSVAQVRCLRLQGGKQSSCVLRLHVSAGWKARHAQILLRVGRDPLGYPGTMSPASIYCQGQRVICGANVTTH
jgi:hypothetical protein